MLYELHVTVKTESVGQFVEDCKEIGVKPIVIEIQNKSEECEQQIMTSSKHSGENYKDTLNDVVSKLLNKGYQILRQKVEIMPENEKHKDFIYYESHFRLKLPKEKNVVSMFMLTDYCFLFNWHYSKNLFKSSADYDYQMITYRNSEISLKVFKSELESMKKCLNGLNIEFDKIEIEEAIYDSNQMIDASWLK
jgi:plasmid maintenance system killer protein